MFCHILQLAAGSFIASLIKHRIVLKVLAGMEIRGIGGNALQKMLDTGPSQVQRLSDHEGIAISLKSIAKLRTILDMAGRIMVEPKPSKKQVA